MDPDLKAYLDSLQKDLLGRMDAMQHELTAQISETSEHTEDLHAQAIEHADRLANEAMGHADQLHAQTRVLFESLDTKIGLVWEGIRSIKETLDVKWEDHEQRIQRLERDSM